MADRGEGRARGESGGEKRGSRKRSGEDLARALANSPRRRILRTLVKHDDARSSVQMSHDFGLPVGTVAYHVRVLHRFGAVEVVDGQAARGAAERFFDSMVEEDPSIKALLDEALAMDEEDE